MFLCLDRSLSDRPQDLTYQDNHHHVRCIQCQAILDFDNRQYDQLKIPAAIQKDFDIRRVRVTIERLCKKCQSV